MKRQRAGGAKHFLPLPGARRWCWPSSGNRAVYNWLLVRRHSNWGARGRVGPITSHLPSPATCHGTCSSSPCSVSSAPVLTESEPPSQIHEPSGSCAFDGHSTVCCSSHAPKRKSVGRPLVECHGSGSKSATHQVHRHRHRRATSGSQCRRQSRESSLCC